MITLWLILVGFFSGVTGGMGLGGGTILVPALTILLGVPQKVAQGVNLLVFLPMAVLAIIIHSKNGFIQTKNLAWLIISGIFFSVVGATVVNIVPKEIVKIVFGSFLIFISIWQFIYFFVNLKKKK